MDGVPSSRGDLPDCTGCKDSKRWERLREGFRVSASLLILAAFTASVSRNPCRISTSLRPSRNLITGESSETLLNSRSPVFSGEDTRASRLGGRGLVGGGDKKMDMPQPKEWEALSTEERDALDEIRRALGPDSLKGASPDLEVLFLRGYRGESNWTKYASDQLNETLEWRAELAADAIVDNPPSMRREFEGQWRSGVVGVDKDGHPIILDKLGLVDPSKFLSKFNHTVFLQHRVYTMEVIRRLCWRASHLRMKRIYKLNFVVDMAGLGLAHVRASIISRIREYMRLFSTYYPETVEKLFIINAPFLFTTAWNMLSPFVHPATLKKIQILGGPKSYQPLFKSLGFHFINPDIIENLEASQDLSWDRTLKELQSSPGSSWTDRILCNSTHDPSVKIKLRRDIEKDGPFIPKADKDVFLGWIAPDAD